MESTIKYLFIDNHTVYTDNRYSYYWQLQKVKVKPHRGKHSYLFIGLTLTQTYIKSKNIQSHTISKTSNQPYNTVKTFLFKAHSSHSIF